MLTHNYVKSHDRFLPSRDDGQTSKRISYIDCRDETRNMNHLNNDDQRVKRELTSRRDECNSLDGHCPSCSEIIILPTRSCSHDVYTSLGTTSHDQSRASLIIHCRHHALFSTTIFDSTTTTAPTARQTINLTYLCWWVNMRISNYPSAPYCCVSLCQTDSF